MSARVDVDSDEIAAGARERARSCRHATTMQSHLPLHQSECPECRGEYRLWTCYLSSWYDLPRAIRDGRPGPTSPPPNLPLPVLVPPPPPGCSACVQIVYTTKTSSRSVMPTFHTQPPAPQHVSLKLSSTVVVCSETRSSVKTRAQNRRILALSLIHI
eukprot:1069962-Amphidinium_carterae.1